MDLELMGGNQMQFQRMPFMHFAIKCFFLCNCPSIIKRLKDKAIYFAKMLSDENFIPLIDGKFKYSDQWLDNFKKRILTC